MKSSTFLITLSLTLTVGALVTKSFVALIPATIIGGTGVMLWVYPEA